jgi:hypothetical protein
MINLISSIEFDAIGTFSKITTLFRKQSYHKLPFEALLEL